MTEDNSPQLGGHEESNAPMLPELWQEHLRRQEALDQFWASMETRSVGFHNVYYGSFMPLSGDDALVAHIAFTQDGGFSWNIAEGNAVELTVAEQEPVRSLIDLSTVMRVRREIGPIEYAVPISREVYERISHFLTGWGTPRYRDADPERPRQTAIKGRRPACAAQNRWERQQYRRGR